MARACEICARKDRLKIEAAIVAGTSLVDVARTYVVSERCLRRHRASGHIADYEWPQKSAAGLAAAEVTRLRPGATPKPKPEPPAAALASPTTTFARPKRIESPQDAQDDLQWLREDTYIALEDAKQRGDHKTAASERSRYQAVNAQFLEIKRVVGPRSGVIVDARQVRLTINVPGGSPKSVEDEAVTAEIRDWIAAYDSGNPTPELPQGWAIEEVAP